MINAPYHHDDHSTGHSHGWDELLGMLSWYRNCARTNPVDSLENIVKTQKACGGTVTIMGWAHFGTTGGGEGVKDRDVFGLSREVVRNDGPRVLPHPLLREVVCNDVSVPVPVLISSDTDSPVPVC